MWLKNGHLLLFNMSLGDLSNKFVGTHAGNACAELQNATAWGWICSVLFCFGK